MSVYRVAEITGPRKTGWEDAAKVALTTAAASLRDLRIAEVVELDILLGAEGEIERSAAARASVSHARIVQSRAPLQAACWRRRAAPTRKIGRES